MKKIISKGITAAALGLTALVMATTFTTVTASANSDEQADLLNTPSAGFSTDYLLTCLDSGDIYENFLSVTEIARQNIEKHEEVVENISDSVAEIEGCVETVSSYASEYSDCQEAYEQTLEILSEAEIYLEAASEADTYIAADMYTQKVEELESDALEVLSEAREAAAAQKAEEEAAAKEAEEKAAAEAAAAEAAAKEAAEQAAAEAEEETTGDDTEETEDDSSAQEETESTSDSEETDSSSSDADATRQALVNYALSFVGVTPYKSGGASLTGGADCSGFTMAIYAKYGYSLSHSSSAQASAGRSVSVSDIKPGDLVCYSGHVGIYIGNGQIVHSPGSGRYVTTASMYIMSIKSVRRIIE